jgi:hypothetical protein
MSMHSLITALRTGSSHAAVSIRDLCQDPEAVPQLLREGGVGALIAAAAPSNPPKIRGWSLSALAILARSENPSAHKALPEALSTLLSSLHSSPPECRAWAAEAMAGICRHADSSSALAVRLGAVPHLLDSLRLARASTAGEAVARSALGALAAIVRVSAGRAQLLGEADVLRDSFPAGKFPQILKKNSQICTILGEKTAFRQQISVLRQAKLTLLLFCFVSNIFVNITL